MYQIIFTKQADRTLRRLPRDLAKRIREKLVQISESPYGRHNNVTKLQQRSGYRLRVGDWRIIYEVEDDKLVILVLKIAPRGGVYE